MYSGKTIPLPARLLGSTTLAAIVCTDVLASTARIHTDQEQTLTLIRRDHQTMQEICQRYDGQIVKSLGDGLILRFASVKSALLCALEFQATLATRSEQPGLQHRIGIHLGEVAFGHEDDLLGDAVNIADCLQHLAQPGGVCLSRSVYDAIVASLPIQLQDGGLVHLNGLASEMRVYHVLPAYSLTSAGQRNSSDQLAAISFTAVVDYNTRMHQDQTLTLGQLQRDFQLMREVGLRYEGKEIKSLGYGLVMAFASAERAVTWAIEVQRALAVQTARLDQEDNLEHRIGIHLGDVEFRDGDVMGDVVNIAARLQPLAAPGGVCLSQAVYDAVMSGLQVSVEDGGLQNLKGIPHPVRVYDIPPPPPVTITRRKVFISYRAKEPDLGLAREFHHALTAAGHEVFMAGESIRPGEDWVQRIDAELQQCDYLLLLLSEKAVASEMVTEEVRRAKGLRDLSPDRKPVILPIRVSFPRTAPLNYDLRGFLNRIQQREWESSEDTPALLEEYLDLIERGALLESVEGSELTLTPVVERSDLPPLPVAEPELPGGQMDVASAFYVVREPIESFCYREITKNGALIRIKAPRQMGKTSLMAHILYQAKQQTYRTIPLTFQLTDEAVFTDLNQFLRRFCALVSRKLGIPLKQLDEYWDDQYFGPKDNCTEFFEQCILANLETPLVLALDEVDQVFVNHRVAKEFLTLLRAWNEQAKVSDIWARLRLVLVHSTEVYIVMDTNSSPFNVGLPIELPEFTPEQVADLADRHGLIWTPTQIQQLMAMIGGHPYLVRVAMYYVARGDVNFAELLQMAATEAGLYGDHLRRHLWNLEQHKDLATAMAQVVASEIPVRLDAEQAFKLHGMGLVQLHQNKVTPRYDMYRLYFRDRLGG